MSDHADIEVEGLTKSFGKRRVLSQVGLSVPAGAVTAILGPSGCGKSTLLRILAGFEHPDSGRVSVAGAVVADQSTTVPAHRRQVGLIPQEGALFPHRSVAGNITFGLGRANRAETAAEVAHWLSLVGMPDYADARPHELSGGQQQRVALARALAARPRVLLLDEPFAALDAGLRVRVREDIVALLREAGTTAILVTHDQAEALSLTDSVAVLLDGSMIQHDAPAVVYDQPTSLAVARFIGGTIEVPGHQRGDAVTTALGTHQVRNAATGQGGAIEGEATVVIRPEQVALTSAEDARSTNAVVTDVRFYGPETAVHVRVGGGTVLQLRQPSTAALRTRDENVNLGVAGTVLTFPAI